MIKKSVHLILYLINHGSLDHGTLTPFYSFRHESDAYKKGTKFN
uniref:Uncharacterized protein n=1 Tax=Lepeophtheirus salmonis TaxID=72036 RepID=A0A0K2U853_LEPSM